MKRVILIIMAVAFILLAGVTAFLVEAHRLDFEPVGSISDTDPTPSFFGLEPTEKVSAVTAPAVTIVTQTPVETDTSPEVQQVNEQDTAAEYVSPVDFAELWAINPYIYAFISIPGAGIEYPVIQHPVDDTYYLDHTIENISGYPGSIFTFSDNDQAMGQFNTIIYGHNMRDGGSMFTNLLHYQDPDYFAAHREIIIYLPDREYHYTVFAAVTYDDRLINTYYDDTDPADRQAFLNSIYDSRSFTNQFAGDVAVGVESHIITLSTCFTLESDQRMLVLAVRNEVGG